MSESDYFAVACAIALMQAVEGGLLLARQGRIHPVMHLSSAVELAWLVVTIIAVRGNWLSGGRAFWAWAFICYYAAYSCAGISLLRRGEDPDPDSAGLEDWVSPIRIPAPVVIPSIAFSLAYGIGCFLVLRAL